MREKSLDLVFFLRLKFIYKLLARVIERSARFGERSVRFGDRVGPFW